MQRGADEAAAAPRTWWCTFTYADQQGDSGKFCPLPSYHHVKLLLRRVQKRDPNMRYLVTFERGSRGGRPHWHALLHVTDDVTKRLVQDAWPHGFSKVSLSRGRGHAAYMAKYASKEGSIRASIGYGRILREKDLDGNVIFNGYRWMSDSPFDARFRVIKHEAIATALRILRERRNVPPLPDHEDIFPTDAGLRALHRNLWAALDSPAYGEAAKKLPRLVGRIEQVSRKKLADVLRDCRQAREQGNDLRMEIPFP